MLPIVIVDDDTPVRELVSALLSASGLETVEADSGPRALAALRQMRGNVSVLLADIQMDGMSGVDLAKLVLSEFPGIPVIFFSGADVSECDLRREVPNSILLRKPCSTGRLLEAIDFVTHPQVNGHSPIRDSRSGGY